MESPNSKTASPLLERCAQFRLELTYKGKILEAILNPDGSVTFDSRNYTACSAAAAAARGSV
ncbi:MAG: hypothetical protein ACK6D6_18055, partial [Planctomyces sp.]